MFNRVQHAKLSIFNLALVYGIRLCLVAKQMVLKHLYPHLSSL